ncbi:MAG: hypothetical protein JXR14_02850 [Paracoccaceae bacterium]
MSDSLGEEPANLKFLRRLVTTLTATMIIGLVVLIALIVIRLQTPAADSGATLSLPDSITLPEGQSATAFTRGTDWYAIVTADDTLLIFDAQTGALRKTIQISD